jgi:hypothetical protein
MMVRAVSQEMALSVMKFDSISLLRQFQEISE